MVQRILYFSFILLLASGVGYLYFKYSKKSEPKSETSIFISIPANASIIYTSPKLFNLQSEKELSSDVWMQFRQISVLEQSWKTLELLDSLQSNKLSIKPLTKAGFAFSLHKTAPKTLEPLYTFLCPKTYTEKKIKSVLLDDSTLVKTDKKFEGNTFLKTQKSIFNTELYCYVVDNFVVFSPNPFLLENSLSALLNGGTVNKDADFNKLYKTSGDRVSGNIYCNFEYLTDAAGIIQKDNFSAFSKQLGAWIELDITTTGDAILFNGYASSINKPSLYNVFNNQVPIKQELFKRLPSDIDYFANLSINNTAVFRKNVNAVLLNKGKLSDYNKLNEAYKKVAGKYIQEYTDNALLNEACYGHLSMESIPDSMSAFAFIQLKSKRTALSKYESLIKTYNQRIKDKSKVKKGTLNIDAHNEVAVFDFPFYDLIPYLFPNIPEGVKLQKVVFYDDLMLFSCNTSAAKQILASMLRNQVVGESEYFGKFQKNISEQGNLLTYSSNKHVISTVGRYLAPSSYKALIGKKEFWNKLSGFTMQISMNHNQPYHTLQFAYHKHEYKKPKSTWKTKLEAPVRGKPNIVINHNTKSKEICVQDEQNNVYLINNSGIVIWKKNVGEPMLGKVHQVDIYKNKKLQYVFSTTSQIHIIDRKGNYLKRYPLKLNANASSGVSIFDYDNTRNYRMVIPLMDKSISMFDITGNRITGWKFSGADQVINQPIQFCRLKGKDYVLCKDSQGFYVLNRRGSVRVKYAKGFTPSKNNAFTLDRNRGCLVTTDAKGVVKYIYFNGTIKDKTLNYAFTADHFFSYENVVGNGKKELVFVDQKTLLVFDESTGSLLHQKNFANTIEQAPNLYNFGDSSKKLGVTDKVANQIYLLNGDGSEYKGFPLTGNTPFSIGFLDNKDNSFDLICGGENNLLINYMVQ